MSLFVVVFQSGAAGSSRPPENGSDEESRPPAVHRIGSKGKEQAVGQRAGKNTDTDTDYDSEGLSYLE